MPFLRYRHTPVMELLAGVIKLDQNYMAYAWTDTMASPDAFQIVLGLGLICITWGGLGELVSFLSRSAMCHQSGAMVEYA